jgi:hypothetical protein
VHAGSSRMKPSRYPSCPSLRHSARSPVPPTRACVDPGAHVSRFVPDAQMLRKSAELNVAKVKAGGWLASEMVVISQWLVSKGEKSMAEVRRTGGLLLADSVLPWKWQAAETSASSKKKILDHPCRGSRTGIKWGLRTLKPLKADLKFMSSGS